MKTLLCFAFALFLALILLAGVGVIHAEPDPKAGETPRTMFKARYHRWVAAIYDKPGTFLMSSTAPYTDFPEFAEIVKLGRPALPAMVEEIEANGEESMFLGQAILQIMQWKASDFATPGLQEQNRLLIQRLRAEKIVPRRGS